MKIFRKLLPLATVASMLFAAGAAQADVLTPFNIKDGAGNTLASNVDRLDWSSNGSGLARGIGPFGTPLTVGQVLKAAVTAALPRPGVTVGLKEIAAIAPLPSVTRTVSVCDPVVGGAVQVVVAALVVEKEPPVADQA